MLFGVSYGTKVALEYAEAHPGAVQALVLDSVVPPERDDPFGLATFAAMAPAFAELCSAGACDGITANPLADIARLVAHEEACAKALGTGLRGGVFWRDMGVVNLPSGQPTMRLTGGAAERLKAMTPDGLAAFIHLSMTDDPPYAQAFVVIEAR